MSKDKQPTQAMPDDGRPGAPDGVNTQADPGPAQGAGTDRRSRKRFGGFFGHGGQSEIGYHGPGQLGDQDVQPGGNRNAGAKTGR